MVLQAKGDRHYSQGQYFSLKLSSSPAAIFLPAFFFQSYLAHHIHSRELKEELVNFYPKF